jgi:hypothetical protein
MTKNSRTTPLMIMVMIVIMMISALPKGRSKGMKSNQVSLTHISVPPRSIRGAGQLMSCDTHHSEVEDSNWPESGTVPCQKSGRGNRKGGASG